MSHRAERVMKAWRVWMRLAALGFVVAGGATGVSALAGCASESGGPGVSASPEGGGGMGEGGGQGEGGGSTSDVLQPPDVGEEGGHDAADISEDVTDGGLDVTIGDDVSALDASDAHVDADDGGSDADGADADAGGDAEGGGEVDDYSQCDAGDLAWSKRAIEVLFGRKAKGVRELQVLADLVAQTDRATVARGLMESDEYLGRWALWFMDELRVNRVGIKKHDGCYGNRLAPKDTGEVAAYIRDNVATSKQSEVQFNMSDVLYSSLQLDDLSPLYRAHLFAMMAKPIDGANVGAIEMDVTRRQDFGEIFSAVYTNRSVVCAGCHNSEWATTDDPDPALDRHWQMPGLLEKGVYGASTGRPEMEVYSMFRHLNVVTDNGSRPWSMAGACGRFRAEAEIPVDPVEIDAYFIQARGLTANVWQVEEALRQGFEKLRADGLQVDPETMEVDGEEALAFMVSARIVDRVWRTVYGYPLTLVHYFPRNMHQRDVLLELTTDFVASGFSLRQLLIDVLTHPLFNQKAPEDGCGVDASAYILPPVFNPWILEAEGEERLNSVGDGLHRMNSRVMLTTLEAALGWPPHPQFHSDEAPEEQFQRAIGVFTKDAEPGFDGVDFQGLLSWENRYGACGSPFGTSGGGGGGTAGPSCVGYCGGAAPNEVCWCDELCAMYDDCCPDKEEVCDGGGTGEPSPSPDLDACVLANGQDWIAELVCTAQADSSATVRDVVMALKDRMINEPAVGDDEGVLIADLFGVSTLDTPLSEATGWAGRVRNLCGVLVESPHFLLAGLPIQDAGSAPKLVVGDATYRDYCEFLAPIILPAVEYSVSCDSEPAVVTPASP